jgi:protein subunit release factor A
MEKQTSKYSETIVSKKDLKIDYFRAGGNGGQNQNARDTGVRITHLASGAVGEGRDSRYQLQNKKAAFRRMAKHPKFKVWLAKQLGQEREAQIPTRRYTYKAPNISLEGRKLDRE